MAGCNFVARGKDDSEVMKKAAEHAKSAHKMAAISVEVEKKARASIRDAGAFEPGGASKAQWSEGKMETVSLGTIAVTRQPSAPSSVYRSPSTAGSWWSSVSDCPS